MIPSHAPNAPRPPRFVKKSERVRMPTVSADDLNTDAYDWIRPGQIVAWRREGLCRVVKLGVDRNGTYAEVQPATASRTRIITLFQHPSGRPGAVAKLSRAAQGVKGHE